jgi:hypothetical protein
METKTSKGTFEPGENPDNESGAAEALPPHILPRKAEGSWFIGEGESSPYVRLLLGGDQVTSVDMDERGRITQVKWIPDRGIAPQFIGGLALIEPFTPFILVLGNGQRITIRDRAGIFAGSSGVVVQNERQELSYIAIADIQAAIELFYLDSTTQPSAKRQAPASQAM